MTDNKNNPTPSEAMEEQLCAFILGELDPSEKAHVEQRIAESDTWRAEHQRLSSTMDLVRSAMGSEAGGGDALSAGAMTALQAVAREQSGGGSSGSSNKSPMRAFMPIAAGLTVALGGMWAYKNMQGEVPRYSSSPNEAISAEGFSTDPSRAASSLKGYLDRDLEEVTKRVRELGDVGVAAEVQDKALGLKLEREGAMGELHDLTNGLEDMAAEGLSEIEKAGQPSTGFFYKESRGLGATEAQDSLRAGATVESFGLKTDHQNSTGSFRNGSGGKGGTGSFLASSSTPTGKSGRGSNPTVDPPRSAIATGGFQAIGKSEINFRSFTTGGLDDKLNSKESKEQVSEAELKPAPNPTLDYLGPEITVQPSAGIESNEARFEAGAVGKVVQDLPVEEAEEELAEEMQELEAVTKAAPQDSSRKARKDEKSQGSGPGSPGPVDRFRKQADAGDKEAQLKQTLGRQSEADLEILLRQNMEAQVKERSASILRSCLPIPNEKLRDMYFRFWGDNPFVYTSSDKQATFAADVDTASYTLARRYLVENMLPTKVQIRTEEFVNYFAGDVTPPTEEMFAVSSEAVLSPFGASPNRYMLRIGVRGKVIPKEERPPMALVYVVDTSGSMKEGNRMELVQHSLRLLGTELDGRDQVGIVTFNDTAKLMLQMTSMDNRAELISAIDSLEPGGSTNVEDGMRLGYELLSRVPAEGRLRRVVLLSDGVANTGQTSADAILNEVAEHRKNGILLSTVGVGMGNHNDALLERLADRGDGICDYVDDKPAARRAMVDRFSGGFIPIARDMKIQVEFDGQYILRYRQLGYENRAVADKDFRNDAVDGGEVGSGHQVTALFELDCVDVPKEKIEEALKLGMVHLRYKSVATGSDEQIFETKHDLDGILWNQSIEAAQPGFQRSMVAAQFAEVLRQSTHSQGDDFGALVAAASRIADLPAFAQDADTKELRDMIERAGALGAGSQSQHTALDQTVDTYRRHVYLCETELQLRGQQTDQRLAEIKRLNQELEQRIRDLCLQEARSGR